MHRCRGVTSESSALSLHHLCESPATKGKSRRIGAKFLNTLDSLTRIDHLFADWEVLDLPAMQSLPLSDARPRIAEIIENNVVRDRHGGPRPE
jgi:hypothetical protein